MPLYFATSNLNKLEELQTLLGRPLQSILLEFQEIQTTSLRQLIEHKLTYAYAQVQQPVIVEDTSLYFHAWKQLPGPLVKWFEQNLGLAGMVLALSAFDDATASAVCCLGYTTDGKKIHYFEGTLSGSIVSPRGNNGFGWDRIFQPDGYERTMAEMTFSEKQRISMRQKAAVAFKNFLEQPAAQM